MERLDQALVLVNVKSRFIIPSKAMIEVGGKVHNIFVSIVSGELDEDKVVYSIRKNLLRGKAHKQWPELSKKPSYGSSSHDRSPISFSILGNHDVNQVSDLSLEDSTLGKKAFVMEKGVTELIKANDDGTPSDSNIQRKNLALRNKVEEIWDLSNRLRLVFHEDKDSNHSEDNGFRRDFIDELELISLPMSGGEFIYRNFKEDEAFSKLDRFSMGVEILNKYGELVQRRLLASLPDHNPMVLGATGID
ncbi:Uncharacterized protein TCM_033020 [Theobroma cacao]|uniref:Uncharacterized protein n=1 Tax=Theobroma cacao TaxID=3641 RepID=A0A061FAE4_THECC|nr:Uncharacterized protein TCM_033020 [Theobroma cacao]